MHGYLAEAHWFAGMELRRVAAEQRITGELRAGEEDAHRAAPEPRRTPRQHAHLEGCEEAHVESIDDVYTREYDWFTTLLVVGVEEGREETH